MNYRNARSIQKLFSNLHAQFFRVQYTRSHYQQNRNEEKKGIQNGPSLRDFIQSNSQSKQTSIANAEEEIVSNRLFVQTIEQSDQNWLDDKTHRRRKVFYEIHGCQMNFSDIEVVNAILTKTGQYEQTMSLNEADVVLVMTCSIRDNAEQKIWNRLNDFTMLKKRKQKEQTMQIGILGCMAERLKEKIVHKEKLVDVIAGPDSYKTLPMLLEQSRGVDNGNVAMNVQLSFEETYAEITPLRVNNESRKAFVSIQRGCDNMCSFCIVPFVRGRERSRPIRSILDEVKHLADLGVKEVTLLGQNVNSYLDKSSNLSESTFSFYQPSQNDVDERTNNSSSRGFKTNYKRKKSDLQGNRFVDLMHQVSLIDPEMRIRFTSPHPKDFPDSLLTLMSERANICHSIHLPAQSGNTACLERMRRGYTRQVYLDLVQKIREIIPDVAFTSDFIAGFCGETEEEHADTISLMNLVRYTFCFVYSYSMREKTKAFHRLVDDVPSHVKQRRYEEMVDVFRRNAHELNNEKCGQTHLVLIDQVSKRSSSHYSGRNDNNTLVILPKTSLPLINDLHDYKRLTTNQSSEPYELMTTPKIGDYVACKIVSATSQSMQAEPLFACRLQTFNQIKTKYLN